MDFLEFNIKIENEIDNFINKVIFLSHFSFSGVDPVKNST